MRPSTYLVSLLMTGSLITAFDAGCVGDAFTSIPPPDGGPEAAANCCPGCPPCTVGPDASTDSGSPDSGMTPDSSPDTGMTPDSGTDTGDPPDSGCTICPDSGADSAVDAPIDTGTDTGTDSGSDGGLDGGVDAADAGPCVDLTTTCSGNQPLICQAGVWTTNGGVCDYACNSGNCLCNDPYVADGGTGRFKPVFGGGLEDMTTSETWYTTSYYATNAVYESTASGFCATQSMRLPHETELMAIIAQQSNNVFCSGSSFDADSQFQSLFSMKGDWYWTDTNPPLLPTHHECVNFALGNEGDADGVCSPPPPAPDKCYTICVTP